MGNTSSSPHHRPRLSLSLYSISFLTFPLFFLSQTSTLIIIPPSLLSMTTAIPTFMAQVTSTLPLWSLYFQRNLASFVPLPPATPWVWIIQRGTFPRTVQSLFVERRLPSTQKDINRWECTRPSTGRSSEGLRTMVRWAYILLCRYIFVFFCQCWSSFSSRISILSNTSCP